MKKGLLSLFIAKRYVTGLRKGNAVPILSRISMVAIAVGAAALIVLFSVFNGFEVLLKDLYKAFYPDIRITAAKGKFFEFPAEKLKQITAIKGVAKVAPVIEDNILIATEEEQVIAVVKGITGNYFAVNDVQPYIIEGRDTIIGGVLPTAILGVHIANRIGLDVNNDFSRIELLYFNTKASPGNLLDAAAYQNLILKPDGIFSVQEEFDDKYILAPLTLVQHLLNADDKYSSLEIKLQPGTSTTNIRKAITSMLGNQFRVETRYEQNRSVYDVIKLEKWGTFVILLFILLIASVNMVGALSLLVLEKQKDMAILSVMGADTATIKYIFIIEGMLWALIGGAIGMLLGAGLCFAQLQFGLVKLEGLAVENYPIALQMGDFVIVALTVVFVGVVAAWFPARKSAQNNHQTNGIIARLR